MHEAKTKNSEEDKREEEVVHKQKMLLHFLFICLVKDFENSDLTFENRTDTNTFTNNVTYRIGSCRSLICLTVALDASQWAGAVC